MILDVIFIVAVIWMAFLGRKRGFVRTILQIVSTILSVIVALLIKEPVTKFIEKTGFYRNNIQQVVKIITPKIESSSITSDKAMGFVINKVIGENVNNAINSTSESIAKAIIGVIITVLVFVLAFFIIRFFAKLIENVFRLPGLNFANRLAGMIWGVAVVFLISYVLLAICSGTALMGSGGFFIKQMESSYIVKSLYENNLLIKLFA